MGVLGGCDGRVWWEGEGGCDGRVMGGCDGRVMGGKSVNVPLTISCSEDVVQNNKHVAGHVECKVVAGKDTNTHLQYALAVSITSTTTP